MTAGSAAGFRLSPQQRRLWLLQLHGGERPFQAFCLARIHGPLDRERLRAAVDEVVERYEILRTDYPCPPGLGIPVQRIGEGKAAWSDDTDLPHGVPGTILAAALVRLAPEEHELRLALPGLAADAATLRNLLREIGRAYAGAPRAGEEEPLQYADLAAWQNDLLEGEETAAGRERWAAWDPVAARTLQIPCEKEGGPEFLPQSVPVPLDEATSRRAARMCLEGGEPLLAAWQVLLWRLTGEAEPILGFTVEGRSYEGLDAALGPFAKVVPLQGRLAPTASFARLAGEVREALEAVAPWQEFFHWEQVAARAGLEIGETVFSASYESEEPWEAISAGPIELSLLRCQAPCDRFRLKLSVLRSGDALAARLDYDASRFAQEDVEVLAAALAWLLAAALADPATPVGELPLTAGEEGCAAAPALAGAGRSVHELFEEQVRRVPQRVAVVGEDRSLTYAELDLLADRLAGRLRRQGIGPEALVGICLERSADMVVALLGVLKAGGAYLPLDPGLPAERKALLLRDAGVRALVTQRRWQDGLPAGNLPVVCLDEPGPEPEAGDDLPAEPGDSTAGNLVYVLYTSGSTGAPKGVAVEHRQLAHYIQGITERLDLPDGASYAMVSTFAADLGNTVLFPSLCGGGCLHLVAPERTADPQSLAGWFRDHPADCLKIVPSHLEALTAGPSAAGVLPRRLLVLGGEASRRDRVDRLRALAPGCSVLNHYGPTETTVGVLTHRVEDGGPDRRTATVPLGGPLPGVRVHLLGPDLRPVPVWFPGELCIGGASVARGYLGQPALTAERFVPATSSPEPGARMYRTGDRARRLPDGTFEFLGRVDDQVKIRGFRVEPGEIEAVLESHPAVRRAAVTARDDGSGAKRLAAYVVRRRESRVAASELRDLLRAQLPEFMVPAAFVILDALPLTPNGKVDRRALPEPDWRRLGDGKEFVAPATPLEETLAEVWTGVLGLERIGAHDHFFQLGGDSIRGIMVRARAEERGISFSVEQLFENPTVRELARAIEATGGAAVGAANAPLRTAPFSLVAAPDRKRLPAGLEDAYPLAMLQAGMLFHSDLGSGTAIYHDLHSFHLRAPFDPGHLRQTVGQLLARHPVLRTSFDLTSYGEPLQLVHKDVAPPLEVHDLRHLAPEEQEPAIREWLRQERLRPFDRTRPPLVAFHVHRRGETFQLTMSFHHAILDGWSSASLLTELVQRYVALSRGQVPPSQAPLETTFRDFVALEREALASAETRKLWQRLLAGATRTRLPRAAQQTGGAGAEARSILHQVPAEISGGLQRAAGLAGVPLKSLLLAVHLRVLSRLAGDCEVLTGVVSHGRPEHADGERVLGLFLNTLPFRLRLDGGSWIDLARRVWEREREIFPHRRFPLAEMQQGTPLFETAFNFLHYHVYQGAREGIEVLSRDDYEENNFVLVVHFSIDPASERLRLALGYRHPEIGDEQAAAVADRYLRAMTALASDPAAHYESLPLLTEEEQRQVLGAWSDGGPAAASAACLHRLFEAQAARTPGHPALVAGGQVLTYAELDAAAERLARRLRALGVRPGQLAGVCLRRRAEMVVALLAVLKAGGAYVPLDPAYPAERLAFTLSDAAAPVLVTERGLLSGLPRMEARLLCVEDAEEAPAADTAPSPVSPDDLGYVIYTSGSTGRPKGVAIAHGAASALVSWALAAFPRADLAAVLASTSICFDLSVFEIFVPLACGGTVVLAENALSLPDLRDAGVTLINTVPSAMSELLRLDGLPPTLRTVCLAGEPLQRSLVDQVYAGTPAERVFNLYGPSEDTTYSTFALVRREDPRPPSVGRPVAGGRVHVLDSSLQPVLPGAAGELWLGGAGLARGYLGRPDLTAERFLPDPFAAVPGERLYRTGDLARHRTDGELEFLGRTDHQVKVRGYRIELGEIEAALLRHPGVREAVALVRRGPGDDARLVAYVVPRERTAGAGELAGALRAALREWLPEPMIPAVYVPLDALPLTPNGKIDRQRLPDPERTAPLASPVVPPRGPVEEALAALWTEVLGLDAVGAHVDFFALGGHSLLATRVVSRVRAMFGVDVPLRALFDEPTVAGFAAAVEAALRGGTGRAEPLLASRPHAGDPPLSFAQQRLWFLDQIEPGSSAYNLPAAVRLKGRLDSGALERSLAEVIARHEALRTTFQLVDGRPVQRIAPPGPWHLPQIDLGALPPERREPEMRRLATVEARRPFDLTRGPLLRAALIRLGAEDRALLLTMHHIVSDAWSTGVLIRELAALYPAFSTSRPSPLPPLPLQYADFAAWQRAWLQGETLAEQLAWWRGRLAGAPAALDLPADRPRPAVPSGRGGSTAVLLPPALSSAVAALGRREGATLFMTLLAAFDALLYHYTGREDLVVGTDVANRNRAETEALIGFFVNQLVLRTDLAGDPAVRVLLARARETALGAYMHQNLPFERLVEELQPERDLSRQPLFQVVFALQNVPVETLDLPGVALVPLPSGGGTAKLDLTVVATDTPAGLRVSAEHSADLFDAPTIARLLRHFATLLEAMAADPTLRLSALPLLTEGERQQLAIEWNDSAVRFPGGGLTFLQLFAQQAAADPAAVAAVCGDDRLTYGELDAQARLLARRLVREGAGPDTVVTLIADRSLAFLAAVLGVFAAGGAYLPLDPLHPMRRIVQIVRDSAARVVLAARPFAAALADALARSFGPDGPRLLVLEDLLEGGEAPDVPLPAPEPDHLAYAIYTSGSTGTPKGAMVEQRGMLNHLWAKVDALGLSAGDTVAQTASQCFDISVWQFLAALLVGGRVHVVPEDVAHEPLRLLAAVERQGVTVLETVPSLLRLMLDELEARGGERPALSRLRWMIPTGEALPPEFCRRWLRLYPGVPLVNAYGPTECSDDVTHHVLRTAPAEQDLFVPIGRPVPNLRLYILDPAMQPLPAGVPGELFAGGAGVGRGYLGDGARTAAAWVPDPFAGVSGARLYRTGDLVRRMPDGCLELLGRIDQQVKVRGHRIELGEIEAALAAHPAVRQAAVLAREDTPGNRRLVAYVVPRDEERPGELDEAKVGQWESIFDQVYSQETVSTRDAGINLRVWISSYTGEPLPEDEIFECFEDSVARILALRPSRVLEIGCGTGLLLSRIAPHCTRYCGTDVSAEVLRSLRDRLAAQGDLPQVELLHRAADDFNDFAPGELDAVILNEVVQYFPSVDYLVRVLEKAAAVIAPGGFLFVGGVRSLPHLETFHTSIELHQAPATLPLAEIGERVQRRRVQEKELVVDPELFEVLAACLPRVSGSTLQLKGGRCHNELSKFRYDVILQVERDAPAAWEVRRVEWQDGGAALGELREILALARPEVVELRGVPDARLARDLAALDLLRDGGFATVGELRHSLVRRPERESVEPADLWDIGQELGYEVEVRWSEGGGGRRLDAVFSRDGLRPWTGPPAHARPTSWSRWANNPLRGSLAEGLAPQLRAFVADRLPDFMMPAAFVLLDAFPLTPNGKLDRAALPAPDQTRPELEQSYVAPEDAVEQILARIWAQVLRLDRVGVHDNFFELGGDSILSIQVVTRANQAGVRITPRQMFQHQTIVELAAVAGTAPTAVIEQGPVTGPVPLTPIQRWFFEQELVDRRRWNQSVLLEACEPVEAVLVERVFTMLLAHHDALRLRFSRGADGWQQTVAAPDGPLPFTRIDLSALPEPVRSPAVAAATDQVHDGLDLTAGPIARAAFFDLGPGERARLHLVVHHLAVDGVSWRILLDDLEAAYRTLARGESPVPPPKTASFKSWAELLVAHAHSPEVLAESAYWLAEPRAGVPPLPVDLSRGANTVDSARTVSVMLDPDETQALLREVPRAYHTQINDVLLTALAQAISRWTGSRSVLVDLEGHGREEILEGVDLSRTVGWFTSEFPVLLELGEDGEPGEDLKAVKEQLRSVPGRGIGYGLLRYLGKAETASRLSAMPRGELIFNYAGQLDRARPEGALFAPARESKGVGQSQRERRPHLLEVNARITGGRLQVDWVYSESLLHRSTIAALAGDFAQALRDLIEHCRAPEAGGYTPSDFAAARLSQGELDAFLARIGRN